MAECDIIEIKEQRHGVVTVQPWDFVLNGEVFATHFKTAVVTPVLQLGKQLEKYIFHQPITGCSRIHSELSFLFQK